LGRSRCSTSTRCCCCCCCCFCRTRQACLNNQEHVLVVDSPQLVGGAGHLLSHTAPAAMCSICVTLQTMCSIARLMPRQPVLPVPMQLWRSIFVCMTLGCGQPAWAGVRLYVWAWVCLRSVTPAIAHSRELTCHSLPSPISKGF
jgi:hypothetical protein